MKFAKVLEQTLIEEEIPEEWYEAAIQYKTLKKCINKVVNELKFLGLEKNTLKLLFEETNNHKSDDSTKIIELNENETIPSNPIIAEYTLSKTGDDSTKSKIIKPMLKITLDFSHKDYTDAHIYEIGQQIKHKIESLLNEDDLESHLPNHDNDLNSTIPPPSPSMNPLSDEDEDDGLLPLTPITSNSEEKIIELKEDENDHHLIVLSPPGSHHGSREASPEIDDPKGIDRTLDSGSNSIRKSSVSPQPESSKKSEIFITLNSDSKFFKMLNDELELLDKLRIKEEEKIITEVQKISELIATLSDPSKRNNTNELYNWRELFRIYLDSEVYFKYNEASIKSSERSSLQIKKNLDSFLVNVEKSGILTKFTKKNSLQVFNEFLTMNYHLLKILQFQSLNSLALKKILKKFDKQTALGVSYKLPNLITNDHIFMNGKSIAQTICFIIQNKIITLIPQLDDYTCPICMSIAYKPIKLDCGHLFCVRCLVKLKQQKKVNCPICRYENAILLADSMNLDLGLEKMMRVYFPVEVKEKLKERNKEKFQQYKQNALTENPTNKHGGRDDKCVIM
ncbi:SPX domain-containing protein [Scheffersomyces coipomensis]|uniref:SPX domain-containing protein n=1 Tax=Scheffersomyces coipomensis TaxID=1788519 RepID=UPI00315DDF6D